MVSLEDAFNMYWESPFGTDRGSMLQLAAGVAPNTDLLPVRFPFLNLSLVDL